MYCCFISKGRDLGRGVLTCDVPSKIRITDYQHVKQVHHHHEDERGEQAALSGARVDVAGFVRKLTIDPDLGFDLVLFVHSVYQ